MANDRAGFENFRGFDRFDFPEGIVRVTAGQGGEALLITGSEKAALYDCGMAYCGDKLIENIKSRLGDRPLDYVLASHTHYDHIGALPFIRQAWPGVVTVGAEHAKKVFSSQGAINTINSLGENAWRLYEATNEYIIPPAGFAIDKVVGDGDRISLGHEEIVVIETGGHTNCSLAFALEPQKTLFMSESTGVLEGPDKIHATILKSYRDSMTSVEKSRNYGAKRLISPHYGLMPEFYNERYWELYLSTIEDYRFFLFELFERGLDDEEILVQYEELRRDGIVKIEQPREAFLMNARVVIKVFKQEYKDSRLFPDR